MYDSQRTSGESLPYWYDQTALDDASDLLPEQPSDVLVIGAGMAGLSTAYHLLKAGRSVTVVDKGRIGSGETGRTTAHLSNALDDHYFVLERMHGFRGARLAAESHGAAIASIEAIASELGIECGFSRVDGYLYAAGPRDRSQLDREFAAAQRAGLAVDFVDAAPLPFATGPALRFRDQAQFQPLAYLAGLARAIRALGGRICTGHKVLHVEETNPARAHLEGERVLTAGAVVVATNTPIVDIVAMHSKQHPYRSYVVGFAIERGSVQRGLFWDTLDPYHYVRLAGDDDLLIVGGEDHKCGQSRHPEQSWDRLEAWARDRFPTLGEARYRWSGQVFEPVDGMAFIGRNPGRARHVYIATGDSGNGITHAAIAGLLLTDLIRGQRNPWAELYDPSRRIVRPLAAREYLKENLNVALRYGDYLRPNAGGNQTLEPGHGVVEKRGLRRVAVYMDDQGKRHECSAICPHMHGLVSWNRAERSWDCPCHGSRFDPHGKVMTGPAKRDLDPLSGESADTSRLSAE